MASRLMSQVWDFPRNAFVVTEVFFGTTTTRRGNLRRKRVSVFAFEDTAGRVIRPAKHNFLDRSVFCSSDRFISLDRYPFCLLSGRGTGASNGIFAKSMAGGVIGARYDHGCLEYCNADRSAASDRFPYSYLACLGARANRYAWGPLVRISLLDRLFSAHAARGYGVDIIAGPGLWLVEPSGDEVAFC